MNEPRRFAFDVEFGDEGHVISAPTPLVERRKRVYVADEVDTMRASAMREGEASAVARAAEIQAQALVHIADCARIALGALAQAAHAHKAGSAELALACARKIAGGALERFPGAPVQAAIDALTREIEAQPRLVVRLGSQDSAIETAVEDAVRDGGFEGHVVFKPVAGAVSAAFVLEWGDGKAEFDPAAATARIAEALQSALAAEGLHGEALTPTPLTPTPRLEPDHGR